jgi:hypothetical protein
VTRFANAGSTFSSRFFSTAHTDQAQRVCTTPTSREDMPSCLRYTCIGVALPLLPWMLARARWRSCRCWICGAWRAAKNTVPLRSMRAVADWRSDKHRPVLAFSFRLASDRSASCSQADPKPTAQGGLNPGLEPSNLPLRSPRQLYPCTSEQKTQYASPTSAGSFLRLGVFDEDYRYLPAGVMRPDGLSLRHRSDRLGRGDGDIDHFAFYPRLLPAVLVSKHLEEGAQAMTCPELNISRRLNCCWGPR